jgi:hypothetical protein
LNHRVDLLVASAQARILGPAQLASIASRGSGSTGIGLA